MTLHTQIRSAEPRTIVSPAIHTAYDDYEDH